MLNGDPLLVCWGGGVNSTAMLIGMHQRQIVPDLILFADTKAEKPETYQFQVEFNNWLISHSFPRIITVSKIAKKDESLEASLLRLGLLPSIAYGYKTCSLRWKKEPQDKYANSYKPFDHHWQSGGKVVKAVGFDFSEQGRATTTEDAKYILWYPLIEWGWGREECIISIKQEGVSVPPKSSCFFCPSSKKQEIIQLRTNHPDLFKRATLIERKALSGEGEGTFKTTRVKGLGRSFSWQDLIGPETVSVECVCFDGDE